MSQLLTDYFLGEFHQLQLSIFGVSRPPICPSVRLVVSPSVCLFVCLSVCPQCPSGYMYVVLPPFNVFQRSFSIQPLDLYTFYRKHSRN